MTHRKGNSGPQILDHEASPITKVKAANLRVGKDQDWLNRTAECFLEKEGYCVRPQELGRVGRSGQLC